EGEPPEGGEFEGEWAEEAEAEPKARVKDGVRGGVRPRHEKMAITIGFSSFSPHFCPSPPP
ncbi:MAG: hypothetical protein LBL19_06020, partial [Spirochaetaceae bacterium]|nr:hypothetical protein [Spirochaetaceae bacterium]